MNYSTTVSRSVVEGHKRLHRISFCCQNKPIVLVLIRNECRIPARSPHSVTPHERDSIAHRNPYVRRSAGTKRFIIYPTVIFLRDPNAKSAADGRARQIRYCLQSARRIGRFFFCLFAPAGGRHVVTAQTSRRGFTRLVPRAIIVSRRFSSSPRRVARNGSGNVTTAPSTAARTTGVIHRS